jgi:hypothetical protein
MGTLFGPCSCCRAGVFFENQAAYAYVPYWFGYVGLSISDYTGNPLDNSFPGNFPQLVYLTFTKTVNVNGYSPAFEVSSFDIYGKYTYTPPVGGFQGNLGSPVHWGNVSETVYEVVYQNGSVVMTLSNPYSYAEAVSNALKLLDKIDLLNPDRIYTLANGAQKHFCYGSEAVAYPAGASTNLLYVSWDINGNPVFAINDYGYGQTEQVAPASSAMNGFFVSSWHSGGSYMDGFAVVKKTAVRNPTGYIRRDDCLADLSTGQFAYGPPAPVTINAGENLFYPSDVPGYGMSFWSNNALPTLPPAKATASETNVTADDTNQTADQQ